MGVEPPFRKRCSFRPGVWERAMDLKHVENQRTELLQLVLLLVMVFLVVVTYLSFRRDQGYLIPLLAVVSLLACLYVIGRERRLKKLHGQLIHQLVDEQHRSASLESRLKEITRLYRAISTVNSVSEPERTFDAVLRAALELVDGDRGSVMLLDASEEFLVIASAQGLSDSVVTATRQKVGTGIAGWVVQQCEPVLLGRNPEEDERFRELRENEDVHFSMSVPLHLRSKIMGAINIGLTPDAPRKDFSDYDLRMVSVFAQHASVAIENARLRLAQLTASLR